MSLSTFKFLKVNHFHNVRTILNFNLNSIYKRILWKVYENLLHLQVYFHRGHDNFQIRDNKVIAVKQTCLN